MSLTKAKVAATPSQISYWRRGSSYPREATRKKIERWSKGAIPASLPRAAESGTSLPVEAKAS